VLCNGQAMDDGQVVLDADDEGFLLGRSAFETLRSYGGGLFALDTHLERLSASCLSLGIGMPNETVVAKELLLAASKVDGDAAVRVTLTASGARIVRAGPLPEVPDPFRCATREFVPPPWLDGTVKHTSRAFSRLAVVQSGADEVIWVDADGDMLEGTRSNVFAVKDGRLITPPVDGRLLAGVTREALIWAAQDAGIEVKLAPLPAEARYDELYVASTLKELTPVASLNGEPTSGEGPVGGAVLDAFYSAVDADLS